MRRSRGVVLLGTVVLALVVVAVVGVKVIPAMRVARAEREAQNRAICVLAKICAAEIIFVGNSTPENATGGMGRYGLLAELTEQKASSDYLSKVLTDPDAVIAGYRFTVYLPDGPQHALGGARFLPQAVAAADQMERCRNCAIYAWPADPSSGRADLAMDLGGLIYAGHPGDGEATDGRPMWNAAYRTWGIPRPWTVIASMRTACPDDGGKD